MAPFLQSLSRIVEEMRSQATQEGRRTAEKDRQLTLFEQERDDAQRKDVAGHLSRRLAETEEAVASLTSECNRQRGECDALVRRVAEKDDQVR